MRSVIVMVALLAILRRSAHIKAAHNDTISMLNQCSSALQVMEYASPRTRKLLQDYAAQHTQVQQTSGSCHVW